MMNDGRPRTSVGDEYSERLYDHEQCLDYLVSRVEKLERRLEFNRNTKLETISEHERIKWIKAIDHILGTAKTFEASLVKGYDPTGNEEDKEGRKWPTYKYDGKMKITIEIEQYI